jgi:hypothetical protein
MWRAVVVAYPSLCLTAVRVVSSKDSQQTLHERSDYVTQVRHKMEVSIPT